MKNYTQVYVKNSLEAAEFYCRVFGAERTLEMKTPDGREYEHCVLSVDGEGGEVLEPIHALPWSRCCATIIDKYGVCWWISI